MRSCTLRVQANNASNLASGSSCHLMLFTCMLLFVHEPRLLLLMDRLAAEEQPTLTLEMVQCCALHYFQRLLIHTGKVTAPHERLVLQVYLGSNALELSPVRKLNLC